MQWHWAASAPNDPNIRTIDATRSSRRDWLRDPTRKEKPRPL